MAYFVYIIESVKDGTYYIGSTQDIEERLQRHNQGRSKYTRTKQPWKLIYVEEYKDRTAAIKKELVIKQRKSKDYIKKLVRASRQA